MWMKLIGICFIIFSGSLLGFRYARRFEIRVKTLSGILLCLTALESYIEHLAMPLPTALRQSAAAGDGAVKQLFIMTANRLDAEQSGTFSMALGESMRQYETELCLAGVEQGLLLTLAAEIGSLNSKGYRSCFLAIGEQLQAIKEQAEQNAAVNVKLFRYLGVCGSLVVVILLL